MFESAAPWREHNADDAAAFRGGLGLASLAGAGARLCLAQVEGLGFASPGAGHSLSLVQVWGTRSRSWQVWGHSLSLVQVREGWSETRGKYSVFEACRPGRDCRTCDVRGGTFNNWPVFSRERRMHMLASWKERITIQSYSCGKSRIKSGKKFSRSHRDHDSHATSGRKGKPTTRRIRFVET